MMQIQGGLWRGRKLQVPESKDLRPSLGRVKASIFSILESIQWKRSGAPSFEGWACADLFAGVGGLGLEMLSRGASNCVFVEKDKKHFKFLEANIASLDCKDKTTTILSDVTKLDWLKYGPFDLVLLDPPYKDSHQNLVNEISSQKILKPEGILLYEYDPKLKLTAPPGLRLQSERKLGPAGISVFIRDDS